MIYYILGRAGSGKTFYALERHKKLDNSFYLGTHLGAINNKFDFLELYRENLENKDDFKSKMFNEIKKVLKNKTQNIFLDEFQFYASAELSQLINQCPNKNFCIIHQFPRQIKSDVFEPLWKKSERKYLFDLYEPSDYYSV